MTDPLAELVAMHGLGVYDASPIKRRRSTKAEMDAFRRAVWGLAERYRPLTGRQLYYRAVVAGLVEKDKGKSRASEQRVGNAVGFMRERYVDYQYDLTGEMRRLPDGLDLAGLREHLIMPFRWITDNTRRRYQADQHEDKEQALRDLHAHYRRDLWRQQPQHVEVWCESDALADVLIEVTDEYGLALLPCRGQAGKRFVYDSAQAYEAKGKPVTVLYVGDFDPSGLDIRKSLHERMTRYGAPEVDFRWLAITPEQVYDEDLPGHGLNPNIAAPVLERFYEECDRWGIPGEAVEAEAMEPEALRTLLDEEIELLIDHRQWELEKAVEAEERKGLLGLLGVESP
jgi:hypothetical protein